jgi:hypothetical protein
MVPPKEGKPGIGIKQNKSSKAGLIIERDWENEQNDKAQG